MSMRTIACVVVEQEGRQRLGQLGLADTRRPEEHERADRPVRILQAGARAAHGVETACHRLALADDALGELIFHAQQLVALAFQHLVDRNAGPARDDLRDVLGGHGLFDHRRRASCASDSGASFQLRNAP
jgi:hypothetical protein